jgi:hypothetical protein
MGWFDDLDEHPDEPDTAAVVRYRVGDHDLDRFLVACGLFLWCVGALLAGTGAFCDQAWLGGGFLLAWTMLRRAMERRAVNAFNRTGRPTNTLDDSGFAE